MKSFDVYIFLVAIFVSFSFVDALGQPERWQQKVEYKMDVTMELLKDKLVGKQTLKYYNNSPDTLYKVFYHLYLNAFQPGSAMDVRSRNIPDPDRRVGSRIVKLSKSEQGIQEIQSLKMNGKSVTYKIEGTILEVTLPSPIKPRSKVTFEMEFTSQIPQQVRRTGRNNAEGIEYSMAQWYPKMCNYDYQGWHANPYIAREFYGVWGDYDVKINFPSKYIIAATGILQNKDKIGYGYSDKVITNRPNVQTWHFKAKNVHDFVWAADPDYKHIVYKTYDGKTMRFFYQPGEKTDENWSKLPAIMDEALRFIQPRYGAYPYQEYSFIQGGDGGMEYPMATLITGERTFTSLVGVSVHEWMHSWYQMVLGSNEALYHWMDEGFTSYASSEVMNWLKIKQMIPGDAEQEPHLQEVVGYSNFALSGKEEPLSTHADHFQTNTAYGVASYTKGEVFLVQLKYIIGEAAFDRTMHNYYDVWKFKHPNPNDFIRIAEKASGLELDWFKEYFVNTTHTIDYNVDDIRGKTAIIKRVGLMPMPLDVTVTLANGEKKYYYIPLDLMRGEKVGDKYFSDFKVLPDWEWVVPSYSFSVDVGDSKIEKVELDVSKRLADVDPSNNYYPRQMFEKGTDR